MCLKPSTLLLVMSAFTGIASAILCGLALESEEVLATHKLVWAAFVMVCLSTFLIIFLIVAKYERLKAVDRPAEPPADAMVGRI